MGQPYELAVPPGSDPAILRRALYRAHDEFVQSGHTDSALRSVVRDSWQRSIALGMDPETDLPEITLASDALSDIRSQHPLAAGMPVIRRLLVQSAEDAGLLVAVSDAAGQLLWVEGDQQLCLRAADMHFVSGADWSERSAGTNAPGTALELDRPVQIFGPEHLSRNVTPWSCSAAPIHDPDTGAILGVLDLTGGPEVVTSQSLSLVRATVAAVEAELNVARLKAASIRTSGGRTVAPPQLDVLGVHSATVQAGAQLSRLSLRHSELLLLISVADDGLTAAELAVALSDDEQALVTIRAELSRLRGVLGPLRLDSRPYRLRVKLNSDIDDVIAHLAAGRLRMAVAAYRGPVLPSSTAPAVVELREALHQRLRSALLAGCDADALLSFADTAHGRDDLPIWERIKDVLPVGSPRREQVAAVIDRLDKDLGC